MRSNGNLDLSEINTSTSHFHHGAQAANKLQAPCFSPSGQISSLGSTRSAQGLAGDEVFCGLLLQIQISSGQAWSRHHHFTHGAGADDAPTTIYDGIGLSCVGSTSAHHWLDTCCILNVLDRPHPDVRHISLLSAAVACCQKPGLSISRLLGCSNAEAKLGSYGCTSHAHGAQRGRKACFEKDVEDGWDEAQKSCLLLPCEGVELGWTDDMRGHLRIEEAAAAIQKRCKEIIKERHPCWGMV
mmetsp:Transcript_89004/g.157612  ORF Transcript_89004/g.157612 Transcript_89004/m.157612 type:complete len:242 (+) Transcript_89004:1723-2448(+)